MSSGRETARERDRRARAGIGRAVGRALSLDVGAGQRYCYHRAHNRTARASAMGATRPAFRVRAELEAEVMRNKRIYNAMYLNYHLALMVEMGRSVSGDKRQFFACDSVFVKPSSNGEDIELRASLSEELEYYAGRLCKRAPTTPLTLILPVDERDYSWVVLVKTNPKLSV